MSFSGGTFSINTTGQPVVSGTTISASVFNALTADLATGLSTCILKDGTQTTTAPIPFSGSSNTAASAGTCLIRGGQIGFPATQVASTDLNTLDDYDEYTAAAAACTGAITPTVTWKLTKIGNQVTLTLPATNGTATAVAGWDYGTVIPAKYRPAASVHWAVPMKNNGAYQASPGVIFVNASTGLIQAYRLADFTSAFTGGANAGTDYAMSMSWTI